MNKNINNINRGVNLTAIFSKSFAVIVVYEGLILNLTLILDVPLIPHLTDITCVTSGGF